MIRVLINIEIGGFSLSEKAIRRLAALGQEDAREELVKLEEALSSPYSHVNTMRKLDPEYTTNHGHYIARDDPLLLQVFSELGQDAAGSCAELAVVEIPDSVAIDKGGPGWSIVESECGAETVAERHRVWGYRDGGTYERKSW